MPSLRPSAAAKRAFGIRLRDLRLEAELTGRDLAARTGFHVSKISRAEHAKQNLSEHDVREWAAACGAAEQIPELVAAHREVEQMWLEYRRELQLGQKHIQLRSLRLYKRTKKLCVYESLFVPGILQTLGYAKAQFNINAQLHKLPFEDVDKAAQNRLQRQRLLGSGTNTFSFILEATALHTVIGGSDVMGEQLDFLKHAASLPNVALGIIPLSATRSLYPGEGFYLFDEQLVRQEFWSGALRTSQPADIKYFVRVFTGLRQQAVYGAAACKQIDAARSRLHSSVTS